MKTLLIIISSIILLIVFIIVLLVATPYIMESRSGYVTINNKVYYRTSHAWKWFTYSKILAKHADPKSFQKIDRRYGKDAKHVFYEGWLLEDADPTSFEVISRSNGRSRDATHIYYGDRLVSNDADNYEFFEYGYGRDRQYVYSNGYLQEGYDVISFFQLRNPNFTGDKNHIRYQGRTIEGADLATFQVLKRGYSKDKNRVYQYDLPVPDANPMTFVLE